MNPETQSIGARLKQWSIANNTTEDAIAEKIGCHAASVHLWFHGTEPQLRFRERIESLLAGTLTEPAPKIERPHAPTNVAIDLHAAADVLAQCNNKEQFEATLRLIINGMPNHTRKTFIEIIRPKMDARMQVTLLKSCFIGEIMTFLDTLDKIPLPPEVEAQISDAVHTLASRAILQQEPTTEEP